MPEDDPVQSNLKQFLKTIPKGPKSLETIPLLSALGRVIADEPTAVMDDPPYSRSIMEGYALCPSDVVSASETAPVTLDVVGEIRVGQDHAEGLGTGKVLRVTTGSFIPAGEYTVVKAWDVETKGEQIIVTKPVSNHQNIEIQGEIRKKGTMLLKKGKRIGSDDIFLLASQGITEVFVASQPKVALFSSGDEVIPATAPFKTGAIWDCNQYGLSSLITLSGGIPVFKGIIKDDAELFQEKLNAALQEADMVVISGGTAAGNRDFMAEVLNAVGPPGVVVNGIPMRSGKPIILGLSGKKPIVCVAGHPPEAARGFSLFGQPTLGHLMGEVQ